LVERVLQTTLVSGVGIVLLVSRSEAELYLERINSWSLRSIEDWSCSCNERVSWTCNICLVLSRTRDSEVEVQTKLT
jgi:hypothetical protein